MSQGTGEIAFLDRRIDSLVSPTKTDKGSPLCDGVLSVSPRWRRRKKNERSFKARYSGTVGIGLNGSCGEKMWRGKIDGDYFMDVTRMGSRDWSRTRS